MKLFIPCVFLCVLSAMASCESEPEQSKGTPEIKLDLVEPDWSLLGDGNWSPWFVDEAGETIWNPSASFNAWMDTIPEEDKAWPILVDVYYKHYEVFGDNYILGALPTRIEDRDENGEDDWTQMVEILKQPETKEIIDRINAALAKPHMGAKMQTGLNHVEYQVMVKYDHDDEDDGIEEQQSNPSVMDTYPPYLGLLRNCEKLLLSHAYLLAIEGETDGFTNQITTLLDCNHLYTDRRSDISGLVASASHSSALDATRWALYEHGELFDDDQLLALNAAIARNIIRKIESIEDNLLFHDSVRRVYNMPEMVRSSGNLSETQPLMLSYEELSKSIRTLLAMYDMPVRGTSAATRYQENHDPEPQWYFEASNYEQLDFTMDFIGKTMLTTFEIALEQGINICTLIQTKSDATRLAIAVHRHKLRHGQFPDLLEDIDKDLLTFKPEDPFTGGLLTYRISPELGPMIYSVGNDLDDDLGRHHPQIQLFLRPRDGDYVYYPDPRTTQPDQ